MNDISEAPVMGETDDVRTPVNNLRLLADIPLRLTVEVGSTSMSLNELLELVEGSVVELDRQAEELLDIMVNGTRIARGEVVNVNGRYGVKIAEVSVSEARVTGIERRR
jgi:flagellar motor switch protein FliN